MSDAEQDFLEPTRGEATPQKPSLVQANAQRQGLHIYIYIYGRTGRAGSRTEQTLPQVSKRIMDVRDTCVESVPSERYNHTPPAHPTNRLHA